jgi:hypothetical protein
MNKKHVRFTYVQAFMLSYGFEPYIPMLHTK